MQQLLTLLLWCEAISLVCGYHLSNSFAVELHGGAAEAHRLSKKYGFINRGQVGPLTDIYWFEHPRIARRSASPAVHGHLLRREKNVIDVSQQEVKVRTKRSAIPQRESRSKPAFNDPLFSKLWYLDKGGAGGYDMNVFPCWAKNITGRGVSVSILDDGIEYTHPDLKDNYDPIASTDINGRDNDPMPRYDGRGTNRHGTRCAGEVAAKANNGVCMVGVAYNAKIGGVRMLDGDVTDLVESKSLSLSPQHVDIYSASWGPDDNGRVVDGPGPLAKKVFESGIKQGRQSKGSIFVWASGNGGNSGDSCACDGYTISIFTISVSSCTERGTKPWYLEECASTLTTTYSSGNSYKDKSVVTTDLKGGCTSTHTGTSASAPLAAGLIALALEARPDLHWRDVQHLVVRSSRPEPITDEKNWVTNGVGRKVSHRYGYGVLDAGRLVEQAQAWSLVPEQHSCSRTFTSRKDLGSQTVTLRMNFDACEGQADHVQRTEHVHSLISLKNGRRGCLQIRLRSPVGTWSTILPRRHNDRDNRDGFSRWPFMSVFFWDENPKGEWLLEVSCNSNEHGALTEWTLIVYGTEDASASNASQQQCHSECRGGCSSPSARDCNDCENVRLASTGECAAACPSGEAVGADGVTCGIVDGRAISHSCPTAQYKDPETTKCLPCADNCRTCVAKSDHCTSCQSGSRLEGLKCVKSPCVEGFFTAPDGTCARCHVTCQTCSGGGREQCSSCAPSRFQLSGACVSSCPVGYVPRNRDCASCSGESGSCRSCESSSACEVCFPGYRKEGSTCVPLISQCSPGQYMKQGSCQACHHTCATCTGPAPWDCASCTQPRALEFSSCIMCAHGRFASSRTGASVCEPCDVSCATCAGTADHCTSCGSGAAPVNGQCLPDTAECPQGTYASNDTSTRDVTPSGDLQRCRPCPALCAQCDPASLACQRCLPGTFLYQERMDLPAACVRRCPVGFAANQQLLLCQACMEGCLFCGLRPGGSELCLRCRDDYKLDIETRRCVSKQECPAHQFYSKADRSCQKCNEPCSECELSASRCSGCHEDSGLSLYSTTCQKCCTNQWAENAPCCICNQAKICDKIYLVPKYRPPSKLHRYLNRLKKSPGLIIASLAGGLVCFVLVLTAAYCCWRLKTRRPAYGVLKDVDSEDELHYQSYSEDGSEIEDFSRLTVANNSVYRDDPIANGMQAYSDKPSAPLISPASRI